MSDAEGVRALCGSAESSNSTRPRPCTYMWNMNEPWSWTGLANWNDERRTAVGTLATCLEVPWIRQFGELGAITRLTHGGGSFFPRPRHMRHSTKARMMAARPPTMPPAIPPLAPALSVEPDFCLAIPPMYSDGLLEPLNVVVTGSWLTFAHSPPSSTEGAAEEEAEAEAPSPEGVGDAG